MNELLVQLQMKMEAFQKDAVLQARKRKQGSRPTCPLCFTRNEPLLKQFRKLSLAAAKK